MRGKDNWSQKELLLMGNSVKARSRVFSVADYATLATEDVFQVRFMYEAG